MISPTFPFLRPSDGGDLVAHVDEAAEGRRPARDDLQHLPECAGGRAGKGASRFGGGAEPLFAVMIVDDDHSRDCDSLVPAYPEFHLSVDVKAEAYAALLLSCLRKKRDTFRAIRFASEILPTIIVINTDSHCHGPYFQQAGNVFEMFFKCKVIFNENFHKKSHSFS